MSLSACILLNEYRKAITINQHTYRYVHTLVMLLRTAEVHYDMHALLTKNE